MILGKMYFFFISLTVLVELVLSQVIISTFLCSSQLTHFFPTFRCLFLPHLSILFVVCPLVFLYVWLLVSVSTFLMISLSANHSILLIFIYDRMLGFPYYSLFKTSFFLFSNVPNAGLYIRPKMCLSTFLLDIASLLLSHFVDDHDSNWENVFT